MVEIECSLAREIWNRRPTEVAGGPTCLMVSYVSALSPAKILLSCGVVTAIWTARFSCWDVDRPLNIQNQMWVVLGDGLVGPFFRAYQYYCWLTVFNVLTLNYYCFYSFGYYRWKWNVMNLYRQIFYLFIFYLDGHNNLELILKY